MPERLDILLSASNDTASAFAAVKRDVADMKTNLTGMNNVLVQSSAAYGRHTTFLSRNMTNLSYQVNDVVSGLLMGQSAFMIFAQQGGQFFQILTLHEKGFIGGLKEIGNSLLSLLTPGRLLVLGFGAAAAAAYGLFQIFKTDAPSAESALEEHARLLGIIKGAYKDAENAAGQFFKQSKEITLLQARQSVLTLQSQIQSLSRDVTKDLTTPTSAAGEFAGTLPPGTQGVIESGSMVANQFKEFTAAINDFNATVESGAPNVSKFFNEIAKIGNAASVAGNTELAKLSAELLKNNQALGDMAHKLSQADAMLRVLSGTASEADKKLLGMKTTTKGVAEETKVAKDSLKLFNDEWINFKDAIKFAGNESIDIIQGIGTEIKSLSDLITRLAPVIQKALLQAFLMGEGPLAGVLGLKAAKGDTGGIFGLLGDAFNAYSGGSGSSFMGYVGDASLESLMFHQGGTVGAGGTPRVVPAGLFAGAQRYHDGGMVLGPNEVPIIAERGERIIPAGQGSGGVHVNITQVGGEPVRETRRSTRTTADGGTAIDVQLEAMMAQSIASGRQDTANRARYGITPQLRES